MSAAPTLRASAVARMLAIARRDLVVEASYQFDLLLRAGRLFLTVATLSFVARLVQDGAVPAHDAGYFEFALVGILVASVTAVGLGTFTRSISSAQTTGTLEVVLATPTPVGTILAGELVVPLVMTVLEIGVLVAMAAGLLGADLQLAGVPAALAVLALTLVVFGALGVMSASFVVLTKRGDPFTALATQMSTFLAGALFPVALLPGPLQALAHLVPPFYTLRAARAALLGGASVGDVGGDLLALAAFAAVLLPLSLVGLRAALRTARVTGTLGTF